MISKDPLALIYESMQSNKIRLTAWRDTQGILKLIISFWDEPYLPYMPKNAKIQGIFNIDDFPEKFKNLYEYSTESFRIILSAGIYKQQIKKLSESPIEDLENGGLFKVKNLIDMLHKNEVMNQSEQGGLNFHDL